MNKVTTLDIFGLKVDMIVSDTAPEGRVTVVDMVTGEIKGVIIWKKDA